MYMSMYALVTRKLNALKCYQHIANKYKEGAVQI